VKQLATYRTAADDNKEMIVTQLSEWLSSEMLKKDDTLQIIAAHIYFEEKNYKEALKLVKDAGENLEKYSILLSSLSSLSISCVLYRLALTVQIYLKIDRIDLAAKAASVHSLSRQLQTFDLSARFSLLIRSWLQSMMTTP
jgi:hypothetical protein